jgi:hypothetical protein
MFLKCQSDFVLLDTCWTTEIRHQAMLGKHGQRLRKANRGGRSARKSQSLFEATTKVWRAANFLGLITGSEASEGCPSLPAPACRWGLAFETWDPGR